MGKVTATIRELRTDFRSVKRKIEEHGEIVITDRGSPAYLLQALVVESRKRPPLPDYVSHLKQQRAAAMSAEETAEFWEEARGGR